MTIIKLLFLFFLHTSYLNAESTENIWVEIETFEFDQDRNIQYTNGFGNILPAMTLIEIKDGRLAVVLSLKTPAYFKRDKLWTEDYRVIYHKKDFSNEVGQLDGESFNNPNGNWVSTLVFLPNKNVLKSDVSYITIQAKKTSERMAILNKKEAERIKRDMERDNMMIHVPFPKNELGEVFDFKLDFYDGQVFESKKNRGTVILLDFWSWNCGPCRKIMPELNELTAKYSSKDFVILGINFDDHQNIDEILMQQNINWPQWLVKEDAMQSAIFKKLNFIGIPYYLLIDQSGILVKQGYSDEMDLVKDVEKVIKQ